MAFHLLGGSNQVAELLIINRLFSLKSIKIYLPKLTPSGLAFCACGPLFGNNELGILGGSGISLLNK